MNTSRPTEAAAAVSTIADRINTLVPERFALGTSSLIERRPDADAASSFLLGRKSLSELGRSKVWASLEAGYGQVFDKTAAIYGRNGSAWEEPSCGYLKLSFSF